VDDAGVRAVLNGFLDAFFGTGDRDHPRLCQMAKLHRRYSDAARRAENDERIALLDPATPMQRCIRGAVAERHADRGSKIDLIGDVPRRHCGGHRLFGVTSPVERGDHAVADGKIRDVCGNFGHDPRHLRPRNEGQGRLSLILPGDNEQLSVADGGKFHRDAHLTRP
jgi:hypothetical protein